MVDTDPTASGGRTAPVPATPAVRPRCVSPTQTPIGRLLRRWTRRPCQKTSLASSRVPWERVWSWFSSHLRPRLGPAGASAGGVVVLDAAESRQPDDQTQADKDQLRLITPEARTVVLVLLCGIIVCSHFICFDILIEKRTLFLYYCYTYRFKRADLDFIR